MVTSGGAGVGSEVGLEAFTACMGRRKLNMITTITLTHTNKKLLIPRVENKNVFAGDKGLFRLADTTSKAIPKLQQVQHYS